MVENKTALVFIVAVALFDCGCSAEVTLDKLEKLKTTPLYEFVKNELVGTIDNPKTLEFFVDSAVNSNVPDNTDLYGKLYHKYFPTAMFYRAKKLIVLMATYGLAVLSLDSPEIKSNIVISKLIDDGFKAIIDCFAYHQPEIWSEISGWYFLLTKEKTVNELNVYLKDMKKCFTEKIYRGTKLKEYEIFRTLAESTNNEQIDFLYVFENGPKNRDKLVDILEGIVYLIEKIYLSKKT